MRKVRNARLWCSLRKAGRLPAITIFTQLSLITMIILERPHLTERGRRFLRLIADDGVGKFFHDAARFSATFLLFIEG